MGTQRVWRVFRVSLQTRQIPHPIPSEFDISLHCELLAGERLAFASFPKIHTNQLLVVANIGAMICESWMSPNHVSSSRSIRWFQNMAPAGFVITLGSELRDDQIAQFIEYKKPVAIRDNKCVAPTHFFIVLRRGRHGLPYPLPRVCF